MKSNPAWKSALALLLCAAFPFSACALDGSVPAIGGNVSRTLLGDGTGVVIGIIDSGVDDLHPALSGNDSLGNPRLVARANYASGTTIHGHGTWVASAALSDDPVFTGIAPDARYVDARVLNSTNGFPNDTPVKNGIGFAIDQGADVLNLSLNFFAPSSNGAQQMDLMLDWAAFQLGINCAVCAGNISTGNGSSLVRSPGSAYNGITVGRTTADFTRVHSDSATAFTANNRMKPDVVAPGTLLTLANDLWESQADWDNNLNGCSFATPHVAGLMAQQIEAGNQLGLSTNPLVVKATIMNSSAKVLDKQSQPWEPASSLESAGVLSVSQPLDIDSGAGQVDGALLASQYLAGEKAPGLVDPIGWDLNSIATGQFIDYIIDPNLNFGTTLTATLTWFRHVTRFDNGNGIVDAGDSFSQSQLLSDLTLQVLKNGQLIAESASSVDNVEHLYLDVDRTSQYTLRVLGSTIYGDTEPFALAWHGTPVPEPASAILFLIAFTAKTCSTRRR